MNLFLFHFEYKKEKNALNKWFFDDRIPGSSEIWFGNNWPELSLNFYFQGEVTAPEFMQID